LVKFSEENCENWTEAAYRKNVIPDQKVGI